MAVPKILLFYKFVPLPDPEAIRLWQRELMEFTSVRGRILISPQGINGTVGGDLRGVKQYLKRTREYAPFHDLDAKWSEGSGDDFPKVSVRVRDELVTFGAPDGLVVDDTGVVGGGIRLDPQQLHDLVDAESRSESANGPVIFLDGRNRIETEIGHFENALVPEVSHTRDFVAELDSGRYDHLKHSPIVTYCTGGVRCEVLSSLLVQRGFERVYQLDGGIARYGEHFGDSGLWKGSLYVFDNRLSMRFSDDAAVVGRCALCTAPTSRTANCGDLSCREQFVVCDEHADALRCGTHTA